MPNCFFCGKKIGWFESYVDLKLMSTHTSYKNIIIPKGFTENDRICDDCLNSGKIENKGVGHYALISNDPNTSSDSMPAKFTTHGSQSKTTMKPMTVIIIAVVCSVVIVLGVLIGLESYKQHVAQEEFAKFQRFSNDLDSQLPKFYMNAGDCNSMYCLNSVKNDFKQTIESLSRKYDYTVLNDEAYRIYTPMIEYYYEIGQTESDYYYSSLTGTDALARDWQNAYKTAVNDINAKKHP
jgi:hypothetical protein